MPYIVSEYSSSNNDTSRNLNATTTRRAQSFVSDTAGNIYYAGFTLKKTGSPTGTAYVRLYAHSGTYGTSSVPTGSVLDETSFDVATLTTSFVNYEFTFPGVITNPVSSYNLQKGVYYCMAIEYTGDASNYITLGADTSSPSHGGNAAYYAGGWSADSGQDICFSISVLLPKADTLSDNFNDNSIDTTKWVTYTANSGVVTEQNNRLEVDLANTTNGSWAGIQTKNRYDLTYSYVMCSASRVSGGNTYHDLTLSKNELPNTDGVNDAFVSIGVNGGTGNLEAYEKIGGVDAVLATAAYNATTHKWWRLRYNNGYLNWDYSADGISWTTLYSKIPPMDINAVYVVLDDYEYNADSSPGVHTWDNYNIQIYTLSCATGTFTETGVAANMPVNKKMTATAASFTLTGIANALKRNWKLVGVVGSFTLTGIATTIRKAIKILATVRTYALTGVAAIIGLRYTIACAVRTYALTGVTNGMRKALRMTGTPRSYALTGVSCSLRKTIKMAGTVATYALTGIDATLTLWVGVAHYTMTCSTASYALLGVDTVLYYGKTLVCDAGSFVLTGIASVLDRTRVLVANKATFVLTGFDLLETVPVESSPTDNRIMTRIRTGGIIYARIKP